MHEEANAVLVISDDSAVFETIRGALTEPRGYHGLAFWARSLSAGMARLAEARTEVILLDLVLPDSEGLDALDEVLLAARRVPILVLTDRAGEESARQAVQRGAKDRVLKKHIDRYSFGLVLKHVVDRAAVDDALYFERERAKVMLNSIGDGVISTDRAGIVTYLNPVAERMTGWSREDASGRTLSEVFSIVDGNTREPIPDPMELAIRSDEILGLPHNAVLIRRDGIESAIEDSIAPIHDQDGQVTGAVMVFRDVSDARATERQLARLAQHDVLTDLPNRMLLNDRLARAIALARRHGSRVAVLFLDVDRFKSINDSHGHAVGDQLLKEVGKRLTAAVRNSDTVSRYGGDEFVVVLSEVEHALDVARHAEKIRAALAAPPAITRHDLHGEVSIGISIFPDDGLDAESLLKFADTAMYHAKEDGRNTHRFFEPAMNARVVERQSLPIDLRVALERRDVLLPHLPTPSPGTGVVAALLRRSNPERVC